jgi:hypothetical protein
MSSHPNSAGAASIKSPPRGIDKVLLVFEYAYLIRFPILSAAGLMDQDRLRSGDQLALSG